MEGGDSQRQGPSSTGVELLKKLKTCTKDQDRDRDPGRDRDRRRRRRTEQADTKDQDRDRDRDRDSRRQRRTEGTPNTGNPTLPGTDTYAEDDPMLEPLMDILGPRQRGILKAQGGMTLAELRRPRPWEPLQSGPQASATACISYSENEMLRGSPCTTWGAFPQTKPSGKHMGPSAKPTIVLTAENNGVNTNGNPMKDGRAKKRRK